MLQSSFGINQRQNQLCWLKRTVMVRQEISEYLSKKIICFSLIENTNEKSVCKARRLYGIDKIMSLTRDILIFELSYLGL